MKNNILLLPGDGVGPEIMTEAVKLINCLNMHKLTDISYEYSDIGSIALDNYNAPLPEITLTKALKADCVLLGAIGTPKHDNNPRELKPEYGLLCLRKALNLYVNVRPILSFEALSNSSSLKSEIISNMDILIVRELIGDIYFGEPRGFNTDSDDVYAYNTMKYSKSEITRIANFAFDAAMRRSKKVTSVDKANVLETSQLWRETVTDIASSNYNEIDLKHMYVDNAAMQLIKDPKQFDVILTSNMFGDILSDEASMLTGSIGMLPSASLSEKYALYEPIHGSAPDIANQGIVNPLAMILSCAMMFEFTFNNKKISDLIKNSVNEVLKNGIMTKDLSTSNHYISTSEMGDKVIESINQSVK
tara:strand:+ start:11098 stop:12180 length:1083 start_codon:yes stop_codon:yes gene_type:complete